MMLVLFTVYFATSNVAVSQTRRTITGTVVDEDQVLINNATVRVKGGSTTVVTDENGIFTINVPENANALIISKVGFNDFEQLLDNSTEYRITINNSTVNIEETVVDGYGKQKKETLVGAIVQTDSKTLERTGGVTNLAQALTGNLPGVVTSSSSGMPGAEDPQILIRAQTSWNNSSPLILVDGIERSISSIDIASVESISVLKDASATAVFGVKGANGVILVTTKTGKSGKATIRGRVNTTAKVPSKLPSKYDSYDALALRNKVIETGLILDENNWANMTPEEILLKYRNPANDEEWDRYPNVDWTKELFRTHAMSYGANANISGGTDFVTYFASADYVSEGDLFKPSKINRGYKSGYGYNRVNVRSNIEFNLTKTTKFSTKLYGSNGVRQFPWDSGGNADATFWASAYRSAPDAMRPVYSDGTFGFYSPRNADVPNSVSYLAVSGIEQNTNTQLTSDFILNQDLKFLTQGLNFRANFRWTTHFRKVDRGINDLYNSPQRKWINPYSGEVILENPIANSRLDYNNTIRWSNTSGEVNMGATYRRINYSGQFDYNRSFGKHDIGGLGLLLREKYATGSEFAHYREDWVFRATYAYDTKYLFEMNGAYNGSEQFGEGYRFDYFPSYSAGWVVSNEKFMQSLKFINFLKFRGSWGKAGSDNVPGGRWQYRSQYTYGGNAEMGSPIQATPYTFYRIATLCNPDISWETVEKQNIGAEFGILNNKISGTLDFFKDNRYRVFMYGNDRAIASYFGQAAPPANLGKLKVKGFEIELKFNHSFNNNLRVWANTNVTHAINTVIYRDDAVLLPEYQKQAGWQLGQTRSHIDNGFLASWDDIYGSTERLANNHLKLPGDYNIIDFNGDGIIDQFDSAPYGYSGNPQNTYNASLGMDWKGLSVFVQFYGVNNVTRSVPFPTFNTYSGSNVAYVEGTYWTVENGGGDVPLPRWSTLTPQGGDATRYLYDGSYLRLKNAEIAYTLSGNSVSKLGISSCRLYVNGNNLFLWTKMPDDRESNFANGGAGGAYPTVRRFNLGLDLTF